jgi:AcrR family transcriptional regulator
MIQKRLTARKRKQEIIAAALVLAEASHYQRLTGVEIAKAAGVTNSAVHYHFGTMEELREQIMRAAVKGAVLPVIAQGLLAKDPVARRARPALRRQAVESFS